MAYIGLFEKSAKRGTLEKEYRVLSYIYEINHYLRKIASDSGLQPTVS